MSDTLGVKTADLTNLTSNNENFLIKIKNELSKYQINSYTERNYKLNTYAEYYTNYNCYKGVSEFSIKTKKGQSIITYVSEIPENKIDNEIQNYFLPQGKGKYKISYLIIDNNGVLKNNFSIISKK
jgi:hypothetical protein